MKYRRLDSNGDFSFGHGGADFLVDSPEAVAQAVVTRLELWRGEWFLDTEEGTPYRDGILGKGSTPAGREALLRKRILETPGVISLAEFSAAFDGDARSLSVSARIESMYGQAHIQEVL
jgi:hypothetical protein